MKEFVKILETINPDYSISESGLLRRLPQRITQIGRWGVSIVRHRPERIIKTRISQAGYVRAALCFGGKNVIQYTIHRLVGIAFIPNPNNFPQINHKDGNKLNNHYTNLEWCDQSHNQQHAYDAGLNIPKKSWEDSQSKPVILKRHGSNFSRYGSIGEASRMIGLKREIISKSANLNIPIKSGRCKGYEFVFI